MIREFKFFHGITIQTEGIQGIVRTLRAQWRPQPLEELNENMGLNIADELSRLMSEQIAEEIDNEIIRTITGEIDEDTLEWRRYFDEINNIDTDISRFTRNWNGGNRA